MSRQYLDLSELFEGDEGAFQENFPVCLRYLQETKLARAVNAESDFYRSQQYACYPFHRSISRFAGSNSARADAPRANAPRAGAPRAGAPRAGAPRADAPRADAPRADQPGKQEQKTVEIDPKALGNCYFNLFPDCVVTLGARRSLLCDLQHGRMRLIPNALARILTDHHREALRQIMGRFQDDLTILEYFSFLVGDGFGDFYAQYDEFAPVSQEYQAAAPITNAIVDFDERSEHDLEAIRRSLDALGCQHLQLRFFFRPEKQAFERALDTFRFSRLRSIECFLAYHPQWTRVSRLRQYCRRELRLAKIWIHSAPKTESFRTFEGDGSMGQILFSATPIDSESHCGAVDQSCFSCNAPSYREARNFNSCLNRKLSIDKTGLVKNCPSMKVDFGKYAEDTLDSVARSQLFREIFSHTKDQVEVCKDCEFRNVCPDCRAYTLENGKPEKCKYDPFAAKWFH